MTFAGSLAHLIYGVLLNGLLLRAASSFLTRVSSVATSDLRGDGAGTDLERLLTRAIAGLVIAAGLVVAIVTLAGFLHALDRPAALLALTGAVALLAEAARPRRGGRRARGSPRSSSSWWGVGALPRPLPIALALLLTGWIPLLAERLRLPPVAWDALTYHLRFPLLWRQSGELVTAQAASGDPGHLFYPLAGEMLLYWQLLATGTDLFSSLSQVPFALMGAAGVAALAIRCGALPVAATAAAIGWLGTPTLLRQSVEPMVDVVTAALFLALLLFGSRWREGKRSSDLLLAAASLGLLIGTKYSGLVYAAAALPVVAWRGRGPLRSRGDRRARLWAWIAAAGLLVLLGGYAYARNGLFGGNPLLPLQLRLGSLELLPGPISLERYLGADRPRLGWGELLLSARSVLEMGPFFAAIWLVPVMAWIRFRGNASQTRDLRPMAAAAVASFALAALLLPFREHRYFLPATAAAWAVAATIAGRSRSAERRWVWLTALTLAIHLPLTLVYWLKDWAVTGPGGGEGITLIALPLAWIALLRPGWIRAAARPAARAWRNDGGAGRSAAAIAIALLLLAGLAAGVARYEEERFARWSRYWSTRHEWAHLDAARPDYRDMAASWRTVADRTRGRPTVVAYAGMNIPYALAGHGLANRVVFASRHESASPAAELRWGEAPFDPLARPDRAAWLRNLDRLDVEYLCVYRAFAAAAVDSATEFPIEALWAESDPSRFEAVSTLEWARVYRIGSGSTGGSR